MYVKQAKGSFEQKKDRENKYEHMGNEEKPFFSLCLSSGGSRVQKWFFV